MMNLSIKGKPESEKKICKGILSLQQNGDGSVSLKMDDEKYPRHPWSLFLINSDGTFKRCNALPDNIGLQVNDDGKIVESEE